MTETEEIKIGDKVLFCDDNGFGIETVIEVVGDYIMTDRTEKLGGWDKWQLILEYARVW